jgi:2-methylisocitrate lyase-like PEP mutase family enzyme
METIGRAFDLPLVANMVETGRTPVLTKDELQRIGFGLAIFPSAAFLSAGAAFKNVYSHIKATGSSANVKQELPDFQEFSKLMGFDWVAEFDKSHAAQEVKS